MSEDNITRLDSEAIKTVWVWDVVSESKRVWWNNLLLNPDNQLWTWLNSISLADLNATTQNSKILSSEWWKYRIGCKVLINGRRGEIEMRGYDYQDQPNPNVSIDSYKISFDDKNVNPTWCRYKEDEITLPTKENNNFPSPKYHLWEYVTVNGRRGKIDMCGYDYIDQPNSNVSIDSYMILFDNKNVNPTWCWYKEDEID